jgi:Glycosyl hydrolases family 39
LGICVLAVTAPAVRAQPADQVVRVDLERDVGSSNRNLAGVGWNTGDLRGLAPLRPPVVRIDAHLDRTSPEPGRLDIDWLLENVAAVRRAGGAPLVILFPTPRWLGEGSLAGCTPGPLTPVCDPTRLPPSDIAAWEALIREVVTRLATAAAPAFRFEVWNEPELAVFWQGTGDEFVATALATHRAVAAVAAETGLPLEVGGPASYAAPGGIPAYVQAVLAAGLPLDFVSWHKYGNVPFLGPDGNEGLIPDDVYRQLAGINPRTTPIDYGSDVDRVRAVVDDALARSRARRPPALVLDEWNLSSGGYDRRHDSNEGAAFALGVLIELERAGADEAAYYRAVSGSDHAGDWGLVTGDGAHKPTWWILSTWRSLRGELVSIEGDDPAGGLWARATRDGARVDLLLASFVAVGGEPRRVRVEMSGRCAARTAEVRAIDASSTTFARARRPALRDGALDLDLAAQSATWVTMRCGSAGGGRLPTLVAPGAARLRGASAR